MFADGRTVRGVDIRDLCDVSRLNIGEKTIQRHELREHGPIRGERLEVERQWSVERTWFVIVPPRNTLRRQLIENRESVEIGKYDQIRLESGIGAREREEPIWDCRTEHRLEVPIDQREPPGQVPIERKLPVVVVSHRLGPPPGAPTFCNDCEAVVRTVVPCLEHRFSTVR